MKCMSELVWKQLLHDLPNFKRFDIGCCNISSSDWVKRVPSAKFELILYG